MQRAQATYIVVQTLPRPAYRHVHDPRMALYEVMASSMDQIVYPRYFVVVLDR